MTKSAIISGGSIGGLFAAAALWRAGWDVDVFERVDVPLSGRGAGIVTHATLLNALTSVGADLDNLGVQVEDRVAFSKDNSRVATLPYRQVVTSWDRMHQVLRNLIPNENYHLGRHVTGYSQDASGVTVTCADGSTHKADRLIGTDGFRSAVRGQMLPDIKPEYAGYVVWRALAHEADLPAQIRKEVFGTFAFFTPEQSQLIGYPIAGPDNDLREGHRRYNIVWYAPAPELPDMLTDDTGHRHDVSIPPPLIREDVLARMMQDAEQKLPPAFVEILGQAKRPFFTPIYDHHSPVMHDGAVALAGDAACVARPHVGMGVTKAAEDALCLAGFADGSLEGYSNERVPASLRAHLRARQLGDWLTAPDPSNTDGTTHPRLEDIMKLTAITVD